MLRAGAAGPAATRAAIGLIDAAFRRLARPPIPGAEAEAWVEALVVAFRARPRLVLAACLPALRAEGGGSRAVAASLIRDRLLAGGVAAEVLAQLPLGEALWFDSQLEGALPGGQVARWGDDAGGGWWMEGRAAWETTGGSLTGGVIASAPLKLYDFMQCALISPLSTRSQPWRPAHNKCPPPTQAFPPSAPAWCASWQ